MIVKCQFDKRGFFQKAMVFGKCRGLVSKFLVDLIGLSLVGNPNNQQKLATKIPNERLVGVLATLDVHGLWDRELGAGHASAPCTMYSRVINPLPMRINARILCYRFNFFFLHPEIRYLELYGQHFRLIGCNFSCFPHKIGTISTSKLKNTTSINMILLVYRVTL